MVITSTSANLRPMDSTILKLLLCGIEQCLIVAQGGLIGIRLGRSVDPRQTSACVISRYESQARN